MEVLEEEMNFDNICRLCLSSQKDLSCIFYARSLSSNAEWTLAEKIFASTSLQVLEHDGLPSHICSDCEDLVEKLHNFKRKCITSDVTLRDQLRKRHPTSEVKMEGNESEPQIANVAAHSHEDRPNSTSPPPHSKWTCEAVDVEVKVEITENLDDISTNTSTEKGKDEEKMTIFKSGFPCLQCDKVFAHKNSLTRHEYSHSDERFVCLYCNKRLTTRETLLRHVKAHRGEKRYRCEHCGKSYTSSTSYSSHVRKHTGERPYKCPECKESFHLSSSLDRHAAKHRGTKAFVCEVCDASFWVADDLRSHVNRVH